MRAAMRGSWRMGVIAVLAGVLSGMAWIGLAQASGSTGGQATIERLSRRLEPEASVSGGHCTTIEMMVQRGCQDCPALSSDLCQLLHAADPAAFAAEHGLFFEDERVRVEIELLEDADSVAASFDLIVEAQYQLLVQALAPLQSLCDLANDPRVLIVRAPIPLTPN
jgi:hypothetical protein